MERKNGRTGAVCSPRVAAAFVLLCSAGLALCRSYYFASPANFVPHRNQPSAELLFRQMKAVADPREHLLFAKHGPRRIGGRAGRADLRKGREQLLGGLRRTMGIGERVQSVGHCVELVFQCVGRLRQQLAERVASLRSNKITRIDSLRQGQNSQIDFISFKQRQQRVDDLVGAFAAGVVAVEHESDAISVPAQKLQMAIAEGDAEHGDGVLNPVLVGHDAIGVAFHDDRAARVFEVLVGQVEAVQLAALDEQRRLGRVDIFGGMVVC